METGLFLITIAFSFGFMIWGFIRSASLFTSILRMLSIAMFMGLAIFIGSGVEVSASSTEVTQYQEVDAGVVHQLTSSNTVKDILIPVDDGAWLGWVFMGFGLVNVLFVVKESLL
jgi:hypothetical protein